MCGRFGLWLEEGIYHRYNIDDDSVPVPTSYNISPGMNTFVVTHNSPNKGEIMRWGLIPPWAKDIRIGFRMINARAETIMEKPAYRNSFKSKRCLVPFNAFYEWQKDDKQKTTYLFHDKDQKYLSFAGLYEIAHDADNREIRSFTIITTSANTSMGGVHDRMPVILNPEEESMWLDHETSQEKLIELLDGYTSTSFEHYEVSPELNSSRNDSPDIIQPLK